jgi:hypothetical protein
MRPDYRQQPDHTRTVLIRKPLRRLGVEIPADTPGTVTGSYIPPGCATELRVRTEYGCFVVTEGFEAVA